MNDHYVIALLKDKWIVLFNSEFGEHENIEDLINILIEKGVTIEEINNPEVFESQGVEYKLTKTETMDLEHSDELDAHYDMSQSEKILHEQEDTQADEPPSKGIPVEQGESEEIQLYTLKELGGLWVTEENSEVVGKFPVPVLLLIRLRSLGVDLDHITNLDKLGLTEVAEALWNN